MSDYLLSPMRITGQGGAGVWRKVVIVPAAIVMLVSGGFLLRPFLEEGGSWTWAPGSAGGLDNAIVNATVRETCPLLRVSPLPGRAPSVISAPIGRDAGEFGEVEIETGLDGAPREAPLRFFWQEPGATGYRFAETLVRADGSVRAVKIELTGHPQWRGEIGRVGVQWPGADGDVMLERVRLAALPRSRRPGVAIGQLIAGETLDNASINYLTGAAILGHGVNYYLSAAAAFVAAGVSVVGLVRRGRVAWVAIGFVVLAAALLADGIATAGLVREAVRDGRRLRGSADPFVALQGDGLGALRDMIVRGVPEGHTFAILSDDDYYPRHRIAYQLVPQRVCLERASAGKADFVAVYHDSHVQLDASGRGLRIGDGAVIPVEVIESQSPDFYLVRLARP